MTSSVHWPALCCTRFHYLTLPVALSCDTHVSPGHTSCQGCGRGAGAGPSAQLCSLPPMSLLVSSNDQLSNRPSPELHCYSYYKSSQTYFTTSWLCICKGLCVWCRRSSHTMDGGFCRPSSSFQWQNGWYTPNFASQTSVWNTFLSCVAALWHWITTVSPCGFKFSPQQHL